MRHLIALLAFFGCFCEMAIANEPVGRKPAGKRLYLLGETGSFVKILKDAPTQQDLVMRDPNLGVLPSKPPAKVAEKKQIPKIKKRAARPAVGFKPMRIAGSVRMPRVEFNKVVLPVGMRDESPSLDFSDRSLEDLP